MFLVLSDLSFVEFCVKLPRFPILRLRVRPAPLHGLACTPACFDEGDTSENLNTSSLTVVFPLQNVRTRINRTHKELSVNGL